MDRQGWTNHSAMPADLSGAESAWIVQFAAGILKKLGLPSPDADQLTFVIRKCAHFTEYLILGITVKRLMVKPHADLLKREKDRLL